MKRLLKLEQQLGKYGEKLVAPPSTKPQGQWVVNEIRTILDRKMSAHSSKPELTQHFTELFCGLEKINEPPKARNVNPLDAAHSQQDIIDAFDEKYFRGQATFAFTTKLLMDGRITDVDHFSRAVTQGGTILRSWTASQREMFQLYVTNKLWTIRNKEGARRKLAEDYERFWKERLVHDSLTKSSIQMLARALRVTGAVPMRDIFSHIAGNWRSTYVLWQHTFPELVDFESSNEHLRDSLNHVSSTIASPERLPSYLAFTPDSASLAPSQIRSAVLRHAQVTKDDMLLDLLLASSEGEDKIAEAGIIATKLALA